MNQYDEESKLPRGAFLKNKFQQLFDWFQSQHIFAKVSILFLVIVTLMTPAFIAGKQILHSHASTGVYNNCIQPPRGMSQQMLQQLAQSGRVIWCNISTAATILQYSAIAALGDSITDGFYNCTSTTSPSTCPLQPNNYLFLYASSVLPSGASYLNFGYAGTTAACPGTCPTTDMPNTNPQAFKNSYIQNTVRLPANESMIQSQDNMENRTAPGIVRANLGEFDALTHTNVIIGWGRNDVDTPSITLDSYKQALQQIAAHVTKNITNTITFLTISPMDEQGWSIYYPVGNRRTAYNDRISDLNYPRELDSFFSAQEWEVAYNIHASVAPLSEYLWHNPTGDYLSTDHIHPSANGYMLIASVLKNNQGFVTRTQVSYPIDTKYAIRAQGATYGEIVSEENGQFYYAEPFYADSITPYIAKVITPQTFIYSNGPITLSQSFAIQTEVPNFQFNNSIVDSMTAYGKGWNWSASGQGLPWVGNGFDLTTVPRFANGPCQGKSFEKCVFDTRAEFLINGQYVESITAYGKYWNFYIDGTTWPSAAASQNGNDLTSVPRYEQGPCKGKASGTCTFTSRKQILQQDGKWIEEVVAYGEKWDWDQGGNLIATTKTTYVPISLISPPGAITPIAPTSTILLDINHDGVVNSLDYSYLQHCFDITDTHPTSTCPNPSWADLNHDGIVNGVDYNLFLRLYSPS